MVKRSHSVTKLLFGIFSQLFLLLAGWGICHYHDQRNSPGHYSGLLSSEPAFFAGHISDLPAEKEKTIKVEVAIQAAKVNGRWKNTSGKVILYLQKSSAARFLQSGGGIVFSAQLKEVPPPLNPNEFDYKTYLSRKNIFYTAYVRENNWSSTSAIAHFSLYGFAQKAKAYLLKTYKECGLQDNEFAMVAALVLGYDDEIDQPLLNAYSHTGTIHVLSVSGLHVGIIYLLLGYLLAFLKRSRAQVWLRVFLILFFMWFFVLLSGFSPPAVRAGLMFSLILIGKTLFENVETSNIVFVSAFLSLCYDPFWLADIGFQLSYAAVLGIIYLYPYFYNLFSFSWGVAEKVWALCAVGLAAQLATLPLTLYYFHQFPNLFLVSNLVLIPLSTIIMYGGMLILLFSKLVIISKALVWLTAFLVKVMNATTLFLDELPFCVTDNIHISFLNMILLYLLIFFVFMAIEQRSLRLIISSLALTVVMLSVSLFYDIRSKDNNSLTIYHSDKTTAISIFGANNCTLLIDTLPDERLSTALREDRIAHDVVHKKDLPLTEVCLVYTKGKKILFAKSGELVTEKLVGAIAPDIIAVPAKGLKRKKQRTNLCNSNKLVISGRTYRKTGCMEDAWYTQDKGAFVLSLH